MGSDDFTIDASGRLLPNTVRLGDAYATVTISGGIATIAGTLNKIAAQTGTTDDLDTISGLVSHALIAIKADTGDTITVKHGTGNINLNSGLDYQLGNDDLLLLVYDSQSSAWRDVSSSVGDSNIWYVDGTQATLTISSGVLTATTSNIIVAAESGTADDLATISGISQAAVIFLRADSGDTITLKHGTGNITLASAADMTLTGADVVMLYYDVGAAAWKDTISSSSGGGGGTPTFSGARVYNSANQTINSTTITALTFNTESYDTDSYHSTSTNTSRLTVPSNGYYSIKGKVFWNTGPSGSYFKIRVNNTTDIDYHSPGNVTSTEQRTFPFSVDYQLSSGDYVEIYVYHSSAGATRDIVGGLDDTWFGIHRIGT